MLRFERYRDLVDDWPAFAEAALAPLPTTLWANALRPAGGETGPTPWPAARAAAAERLAAEGVATRPLESYGLGLRAAAGSRPGKTLTYLSGGIHIQEEVSMLPIQALDPQPGERLLDLCSAPGNKTVQAAIHMRDSGTIVANDLARDRIGRVLRNLERLGVTNTAITRADASSLPRAIGLFDRVLADVPCSCEGTTRKSPRLAERPHGDVDRTGAQRAILEKAVRCCRPGGRIVYSTCSYAPEENEAIVDDVLASHEDLEVVPIDFGGLRVTHGLEAWEGRRFDPRLRHAVRLWPHHNDTGGFFVALLERREDALADRSEP